MISKITESTGGKIGIAIFAVVALGLAIFAGFRATSDDSKPADPAAVREAAQKQIDVIEKQNLPPALKQEMIAHQQGLLNGGGHGGPTAPPTSGTPGK